MTHRSSPESGVPYEDPEFVKGPDDCAEYMLLQARQKGQEQWTNIYAAQLGQFIGYGCEVRALSRELLPGEAEVDAWVASLPGGAHAQCAPTDPLTDLVERFSKALLAKLRLAEANGRSGWDRDDWEKQCQEGLLRHVDKGDPRDVAAYCAFMWHHGWITALTSTEQYDPAFVEEIKRAAAAPPEAEFSNAQEALEYLNGIAPLPGLVTTLRSYADDCEDMERWAVPELSPLLRRAADVIEAGVSPVTRPDSGEGT